MVSKKTRVFLNSYLSSAVVLGINYLLLTNINGTLWVRVMIHIVLSIGLVTTVAALFAYDKNGKYMKENE